MKNEDYFNTEIYNNKGVSNNELQFNTETFNYRQSNDNSYKSKSEARFAIIISGIYNFFNSQIKNLNQKYTIY